MKEKTLIYRKAEKDDYSQMADIHIEAFKSFFLTTLGKSFLSTYYRSALRDRDSVAICSCDQDKKIVGFAIGTVSSKGYHKRLLFNNFFRFMLEVLFIIFSNPKAIIRLMLNLNKAPEKHDDGQYSELLSIGVIDSMKGYGVGKKLLRKFEHELMDRGFKKLVLTTDYFNNKEVINFYFSQGYSIFYEFTTYPERRMYKLVKDLTK
jgi:ribosomal protein S18 acetylase RimI-like enzyme